MPPVPVLDHHSNHSGWREVLDGSQSYEARFDDTDSPVSLKQIDDYTIEETHKRDGKVVGSNV